MSKRFLNAEILVPWLQRFVRFRSEQTDLHEADPNVRAFITECAAPLLREIGAEVRFDAMGNLILEAGPTNTGRSLMFVAYAMTHPASNMTEPFEATVIETNRGRAVRGRGVAEQKTALAALVGVVAETLAAGDLDGRLIVTVMTAGETGRHDAIESVMAGLTGNPTGAVICIGTTNRVAIGNKGRIDFDVTVSGQACHSSTPWNGVNALSGARRLLERFERIDLGVPDHAAFGPATLTPTAIESAPRATHTVPDTVRITFDRRLLPGEDAGAAFEAIVDETQVDEPWRASVKRGPIMYPNEIRTDSWLYGRIEDAFAAAALGAPEPFACNFALDAGYFARQGIEAVMLGPGEVDQFHSNEEHVLIDDLVAMANVYYGLVRACLCSGA